MNENDMAKCGFVVNGISVGISEVPLFTQDDLCEDLVTKGDGSSTFETEVSDLGELFGTILGGISGGEDGGTDALINFTIPKKGINKRRYDHLWFAATKLRKAKKYAKLLGLDTDRTGSHKFRVEQCRQVLLPKCKVRCVLKNSAV